MSLNLTKISNQYEDYAGWYAKAYETGTTTPKGIYFDDNKLSGAIKVKIDKDGFFISSGGAKVILHIEGYYDIFFFPSAEEADNNDFTNAKNFGDGLVSEISGDTVTKASETEYGTIRFAKDQEILIGEDFSDNVVVSEEQITLLGELSASEQKASDEDLDNSNGTMWVSPSDINYLIENKGVPEDPIRPLEIGDVIWLDPITAKAKDDILPANGEPFDAVDYPVYATYDGVSQEGGKEIAGWSNPQKTAVINTGGNGRELIYIKLSDTLYYGYIHESVTDSGLYNVCKSEDAGLTWTVLPQSQTGANPQGVIVTMLAWDGGDYICFRNTSTYISMFQISTETFTILNYNMFNGVLSGTGHITHWNENLGKFVVFNNRDDQNNLFVSEFVNDPSVKTVTQINAPTQNFDYGRGIYSVEMYGYLDGKYYIYDIANYDLYSLTEGVWDLTLVHSFTPTLNPNHSIAGQSNKLRVCFNKLNEMAFVISWDDSTKQVEVAYSTDMLTFEQRIINTGMVDTMTFPPYLSPVFDSWSIHSGSGQDTVVTKDFTSVLYPKTDWNNTQGAIFHFSDYDTVNDVLKEYTVSASQDFNIYVNTIDATVNVIIGESTTPNMSYECIGNIKPYVKAK